MKYLIRKTLIFILAPALAIVSIIFIASFLLRSLAYNDKVDSNISTVFIGDSHIQLAINDSIITQSLNLAKESESFYFSFFKLKMLLESNTTIKHVYLGLGFHSLSDYCDKSIDGQNSSSIAPTYYCIMPVREQLRIIYWNRTNLAIFMKNLSTEWVSQALNNNDYSFMGGFLPFRNDELFLVDSIIDDRLNSQFFNNGNLNSFSDLNILYLYKIADLCKINDVDFTVLNTPLHEYYYQKTPKAYKDKLNEIILAHQWKYIDLSCFMLNDNCFMPDGDHISSLGAEKTSIKLKEIINANHN